jgi:hypothetical protein
MEKIRKFIKDTLITLGYLIIFTLWCFAMSKTMDYVIFGH